MLRGILWLLTVSAFPFSGDAARDAIESFDPARIHAVFATPPKKPDLLAAKTPKAAGEQLRRYFSCLGHKGLAAVQHDADTTLALQAAWLLALGPGDTKTPPCPKRFVRFLEARIGVKVPPSWEYDLAMRAFNFSPDHYRLQSVAEKERKASVVSRMEEIGCSDKIILHAQDVVAPSLLDVGTNVRTCLPRKNGKIVFRAKNGAVEILEADLPDEVLDYPVCVALIGPERSFIAFHEARGNSCLFPLLCVDSHSGKILWQREIWGSAFVVSIAGVPCYHELTLVPKDGQILLLGTGTDDYVEALDVKTGNPVFRFCANHWLDVSTDDEFCWRRSLWRWLGIVPAMTSDLELACGPPPGQPTVADNLGMILKKGMTEQSVEEALQITHKSFPLGWSLHGCCYDYESKLFPGQTIQVWYENDLGNVYRILDWEFHREEPITLSWSDITWKVVLYLFLRSQ